MPSPLITAGAAGQVYLVILTYHRLVGGSGVIFREQPLSAFTIPDSLKGLLPPLLVSVTAFFKLKVSTLLKIYQL